MPTKTFDLDGLLPKDSAWHAAVGDDPLHGDDACLAAYREARTLLGIDDAKASDTFRRVRQLLAKCPSQDHGLGAASIGWEARAELNMGHVTRAAELYVEHYATGDATAPQSLQIVCGKLLASDVETLASVALHPELRRVVTLYLAARGGPFRDTPSRETALAWLAAIERVDTANLECADLLAWAAYQAGDYESARRWTARAPQQSAATAWIRSKLLLRQGRQEEAAAVLAQAVREFPAASDWPVATKYESYDQVPAFDAVRGELASLRFDQGDAVDALDLFLRAGFWTDAAHVAERVLSIEALQAYAEGTDDPRLRHLLGRRLVRLARYDDARKPMPEALRPKLDELAAALVRHDPESLWQAAQIVRWHGMELMGTELAPDWFIHEGSFDWGFDDEGKLTPPAADVQPMRRFHYRYKAADLAWEAAAGMPDGSEATARVLCEAGTWLKTRDPQAADRFYKALVNRCRNTPLGREADALRWFPQVP